MVCRTHNISFQIVSFREITFPRAKFSFYHQHFRFQWDRKASRKILRFRNRLLYVDLFIQEEFERWDYTYGDILSCAGEMAMVEGPVAVVNPVRSPLVSSLFACETLGVRKFFLSWLLPWASAELSS
jgi:hypothetical protein